jgi:hypothetical protein
MEIIGEKLDRIESPRERRAAFLELSLRYVRPFARGYRGAMEASAIFHKHSGSQLNARARVVDALEEYEAAFRAGLEDLDTIGSLTAKAGAALAEAAEAVLTSTRELVASLPRYGLP